MGSAFYFEFYDIPPFSAEHVSDPDTAGSRTRLSLMSTNSSDSEMDLFPDTYLLILILHRALKIFQGLLKDQSFLQPENNK